MTQSFGLNRNNDIYIGSDGNLVIENGEQAVLNACANVAKASLGEEVLSINNGVPYFQAAWSGAPNIAVFESYLRNAFLSVDGVVQVVSLSTSIANNTLSYIAQIESVYGTTFTTQGEFPLNV